MSLTNTYVVEGKRSSKTVNGVEHKYVVLGDRFVREFDGNVSIDYFYDNDSRPYKMTVDNGTSKYTGYYVLNLQGDVIAIMNSSGTAVVKYTYDAWGNQVSYTASGSNLSILYQYNALKYRGYYHDKDLGTYYLNYRYYDPAICRFINADDVSVLAIGQGSLLQFNLYTYCLNNPITYIDSNGTFSLMGAAMFGGAVAGALVSGISYAASIESGESFDFMKMFATISTGAITGAASGWLGMKQYDIVTNGFVSIIVGGLAGFVSGCITEDPLSGFCTAVATGLACFSGTLFNSVGTNASMTGQMNFYVGLLTGLPCEMASFSVQVYADENDLKCPVFKATTVKYDGYDIPISPGASGQNMTIGELFQVWNRTGFRPGAFV